MTPQPWPPANFESGWPAARTNQIFRILNGATPASGEPAFWGGSIPWITPTDFSSLVDGEVSHTARSLTTEGFASSGTTIAPAGSIVLTTRAPIGLVARTAVDLCCNQGCRILVPRVDVDTRYFYYQLRAMAPLLAGIGQGSTFLELTTPTLASLSLVMPPRALQSRIAAALDVEFQTTRRAISSRERELALLAERHAAFVRSVLTGRDQTGDRQRGPSYLGNVPRDWKVARLGTVMNAFVTGATPPTSEPEYLEDGTVPWFTPASFTDELDLTRPERLLNVKAVSNGVVRSLPAGTVMIVGIGATTGKVGQLSVDGTSNQQITALVHGEELDSRFLAWQMWMLQPTLRAIAPVSTLPILRQHELKGIQIAVPPLDEQRRIAAVLDAEADRVSLLRQQAVAQIRLFSERFDAAIYEAVIGMRAGARA